MPRRFGFISWLFLFFIPGFLLKGEVVRYETTIKIEKNKKVTEKFFLININSRADQHLADVEIRYQGILDFKLLEAAIIGPEGKRVRKLKNRDIKTRSDLSYESFYNDGIVKEFDLHWNEYPYQIKYAYRTEEEAFVSVLSWSPYFNRDIRVQKASLRVELPADYPFHMDYSDQFQFSRHEDDGKQIMHWQIRDFKTPEEEMFSPPGMELIPGVTIFPEKFNYGIEGRADSWASYGQWFDSLNEGQDRITVGEKNRVDQMIEGLDDKREITKTLYHYLQDNVRYVNVRLDIGGLKSYPAHYVCRKKYGDCKALTTYMKGLLKYAGIPSFYVLIRAGKNVSRIKTDLPGQQFNHTILCVPLESDTLWLENTAGTIPFNYQGVFLQNRLALLVNKDSSRLVTIPAMGMDEVHEQRNYNFSLDELGNGKVTVNNQFWGAAFEKYKYYQEVLTPKEQKRELSKDTPVRHSVLTDWSIAAEGREEQHINVDMEISCRSQFREIGNMLILQPPVFIPPMLEIPDERTHPVRVNIPINKTDSMVYNLSFSDNVDIQLPEDAALDTRFGKYETRYLEKDNQIIVISKFQLFSGDYPQKVYKEFFDFFKQMERIRQQSGVLISVSRKTNKSG